MASSKLVKESDSLMFKWDNEEIAEAEINRKIKVNIDNSHVIDWAFENLSNKDENGFEEAWERIMIRVVERIRTVENGSKCSTKERFEELTELTKKSAELVEENLSDINFRKMDELMAQIRSNIMHANTFGKKRKIAERLAKPNWMRKIMND